MLTPAGAQNRRARDELLYFRIEEQFYSGLQYQGAASPPRQLVTHGIATAGGNFPRLFGNATLPAGATMPVVAGRGVVQVISGAATAARGDSAAENAAMPISQIFNGVDAINGVLRIKPLRQYYCAVPVRRLVAGTSRLECGLVTNPINGLTFGGAPPGLVWSSDPAVNAGRWLSRYRQVNAGAIVDGPDTGIAPTAWHLLGMRYTEGGTPRLELLIDNVPLRIIEGDASMPTFPGGINLPGWIPFYGVSTPAGSTWQFGEGVFEIHDI